VLKGGLDLEEFAKLNQYDPSTVLVYRQGDLERARRDLDEGARIAALLLFYLDGVFLGRRRPFPGFDATEMRDQLFQLLCGKRLFREALARIHAGRQNSPQSPP
jgi:hypothetical protein